MSRKSGKAAVERRSVTQFCSILYQGWPILFMDISSTRYTSGIMTKKWSSAGAFCRYNSGRLSPLETLPKRGRNVTSIRNEAGLRLMYCITKLHRNS